MGEVGFLNVFSGSGEPDMNRFGSHPKQENRPLYEGSRLRASPRHSGQRVFFEFFNHMAVGIKSSSNYDFYDTGYAFIETTRPTIITYVPDTYMSGFKVSSNPHIIHLNEEKKVLDVSTYYRDAIKMKQLEARWEVLDQGH